MDKFRNGDIIISCNEGRLCKIEGMEVDESEKLGKQFRLKDLLSNDIFYGWSYFFTQPKPIDVLYGR